MLTFKRGITIPMLALATAGCLWGTGFFFGKIALAEMPVATMVLFRFVFACAGLLPFIFFDRPRFAGSEWGWVFAASVFGVPVSFLVQFKGLSLTTVSHASLMVGTLPMLLAMAAVLFSGERLHFGGWLALGASTVGAALIALSSETGSSVAHASVRGDLLVVLSMLAAIAWILISSDGTAFPADGDSHCVLGRHDPSGGCGRDHIRRSFVVSLDSRMDCRGRTGSPCYRDYKGPVELGTPAGSGVPSGEFRKSRAAGRCDSRCFVPARGFRDDGSRRRCADHRRSDVLQLQTRKHQSIIVLRQGCKRGEPMIARIWHGKTKASDATAYLEYLFKSGIPAYRATNGNKGAWVLRRVDNDVAHFITLSFWESREAIAAFAGADLEVAKYYGEDEKYLLEFEPTVTHYELFQ